MAGELVRQPPADGQIHKNWSRFVGYLAIPLLLFDANIFSETRDYDLSNGVGPVSVYASWKKLLGHQGRTWVANFGF